MTKQKITIGAFLSNPIEGNYDVSGVITKLGPVTDSTNGKYRFGTLEGEGGQIDLRILGGKCDELKTGVVYEIQNGWFKQYKDKWQINIGKTVTILPQHGEWASFGSPLVSEQQTLSTSLPNNQESLQEFVTHNVTMFVRIAKNVGVGSISDRSIAQVFNTSCINYWGKHK